MKTLLKYSFLFILLCLFSCRKDEIIPTSGQEVLSQSDDVSFLIQIVDDKYNGIPNATLKFEGISEEYKTDKNGVVDIKNISVPKPGIYTTITAQFYHKQIKLLNGASKSKNVKTIKLLDDRNFSIIATGSEGSIYAGGKLKLPNELILQNGSTYQGNVTVKNNYINPNDADFLVSSPGNMLALNEDNDFITLASLGMYRIELFTPTGELLKIKQGDKATLSFPVAEIQQNNAPSSVPLWSLDEVTALWKQEGNATLSGNYYIAEVSHFSFWNIDLPFEFDEICFKLKQQDGTPIPGLILSFFVNDDFKFGFEAADNEGKVCGRIPLGVPIKIKVSVGVTVIQTYELGPYTLGQSDVDLILTNTLIEVKGKAVTCTGSLVTNGYGYAFNINGGLIDQLVYIEVDGSFEYYTGSFDQNLVLVDKVNDKSKIIELKSPLINNDVDLGLVEICEAPLKNKISGYVYIDNNEDGVNDLPFEGVKITINTIGTFESVDVFTDANGFYCLAKDPGKYQISCETEKGNFLLMGGGDLSIDGATEGDLGFLGIKSFFNCTLEINEHDQDNNWQFSPAGKGGFSGEVLIDLNDDGIGDKTAEGFTIFYNKEAVLTDKDGKYQVSDIPNFNGELKAFTSSNFTAASDYDLSPDPDGDDRSLGPNFTIPIRLKNGENDKDNNFVVKMDKSRIVVRVLEDTNNDGIGDQAVKDQRIELYQRSSTGVPMGQLIGAGNSNYLEGYLAFNNLEPGEYVLYFIGSIDYSAKSSTDLIPDNNPVNMTTEKFFLPVNIVGKEFDDGNTFIVKKK